MIKKVNNCVGCSGSGLPCRAYCELRDNSYEYYCDSCGDEFDPTELYEYDGDHLCKDCLLDKFHTLL